MLKSQWNIDINRIMSNLGESVKKKAERTAQAVYDGVVDFSPVDTGQFRASWNISENSPNFNTVDVGGISMNPLPRPNQIARAASNFPIFFISNGKDYGQILEYGNSRQAPSGMVRLTLAKLK